jgi:hypothetical protein
MFTRAEGRHPPQRGYDRLDLSQCCSCSDERSPERQLSLSLHPVCRYDMGLPLMEDEEHAASVGWVGEEESCRAI